MTPASTELRRHAAVVLGAALIIIGSLKLTLAVNPPAAMTALSLVEISLGIWLATQAAALMARISAAALLACFVGYRVLFATGLECGCFGARPVPDWLGTTVAVTGFATALLCIVSGSSFIWLTARAVGSAVILSALAAIVWIQVKPNVAHARAVENAEQLRIVSRILSNSVSLQDTTKTVILHDSSCSSCTRADIGRDLPAFAEVVDLSLLRLPEDVPERGMLKNALWCLPLVGVVDREGGKVQVRAVRCLEDR